MSETNTRENDGYVCEFTSKSLTAVHIPILEFKFKNLERLKDILEESLRTSREKDEDVGLIVTSPRVVEAISHAVEAVDHDRILSKLHPDLIFVVGDRSGLDCGNKLNVKWNTDSASSGNGSKLAAFIGQFCRNRCKPIRLIYPKSSLADNSIEETLSADKNVNIDSIIAYETTSLQDIHAPIVERLKRLVLEITDIQNYRVLVLNFIFFSPSGVDGFFKFDLNDLITELYSEFATNLGIQIETRFSSIGKTTEVALKRHGCDVFCTADKPSAQSLVDNIMAKCQVDMEPKSVKEN